MRHHLNLALSLLLDGHHIAQIPHPSIDLDFVVQELLEGTDVEDLVRGRLRGIDDELSSPPSDASWHGVKFRGHKTAEAFVHIRESARTGRGRKIRRHTLWVTLPLTFLPFGPVVFCYKIHLASCLFSALLRNPRPAARAEQGRRSGAHSKAMEIRHTEVVLWGIVEAGSGRKEVDILRL